MNNSQACFGRSGFQVKEFNIKDHDNNRSYRKSNRAKKEEKKGGSSTES